MSKGRHIFIKGDNEKDVIFSGFVFVLRDSMPLSIDRQNTEIHYSFKLTCLLNKGSVGSDSQRNPQDKIKLSIIHLQLLWEILKLRLLSETEL